MGVAFILALLSKEQAMTLPALATVYEHFYREDRSETSYLPEAGPLRCAVARRRGLRALPHPLSGSAGAGREVCARSPRSK